MKYEALSELELMSKAVNYNKWILEKIRNYLGKRILEVGAGMGTFTSFFLDREKIISVDVAPNCVDYLKQRFKNIPQVDVLQMDVSGDSETKKILGEGIDTIVCLNVLEHIEDDLKALKNLRDVLIPNGKLILMVPAFPFAFGTIDQLDGHFRRYKKRELKNKLESCGFKLLKIFYFNSLGLWGWYFNNRMVKKKSNSLQQVLFYDRVFVPILSFFERIISPPFGQSLMVIAQN